MTAGAISTVGMPREQWLEERKKGIGSSDAAIAIGMSPYATPYRLWLEKTNQVEPDDLSENVAVQLGIMLESAGAEMYERETGRKVQRVNRILRHDAHPWMLANLDRRVVGEKRIVEIKTAGLTNAWAVNDEDWGPPGTDKVPSHYLIQVMHQLIVTGYPVGDLYVIFGGRPPATYTIHRDEALIEMMIRLEAEFWQRVVTMTPPEPTSLDDVRRRFPRHSDTSIEATAEILGEIADLRAAQERAKELDVAIDAHKARIAAYLGEHGVLTDLGKTILTYRTQERAEYVVPASSTRVMRLSKGSKK